MFKKSIYMNKKTTISVAMIIKEWIESKGSKSDSYEDILIEQIPALKDYLIEKKYLIIETVSEDYNKNDLAVTCTS